MTREDEGWIVCCNTADGETIAASAEGDHRCHCGRLLFRHTAKGLELKCPRCKRVVFVQLLPPQASDLASRAKQPASPAPQSRGTGQRADSKAKTKTKKTKPTS